MALCPKCEKPLVKAKQCSLCGWEAAAVVIASSSKLLPQPGIENVLQTLTEELMAFRGQRPATMPVNLKDAAHWLLEKVLEKQQPEETVQQRNKTEGKGDNAKIVWFWVWSYITRIKIQSRQFLRLSPEYQRYIIAAKEDGIPWRGDDEQFFRKIVSEHQRILEVGVEAYCREASAKMRGMMQVASTQRDKAAA